MKSLSHIVCIPQCLWQMAVKSTSPKRVIHIQNCYFLWLLCTKDQHRVCAAFELLSKGQNAPNLAPKLKAQTCMSGKTLQGRNRVPDVTRIWVSFFIIIYLNCLWISNLFHTFNNFPAHKRNHTAQWGCTILTSLYWQSRPWWVCQPHQTCGRNAGSLHTPQLVLGHSCLSLPQRSLEACKHTQIQRTNFSPCEPLLGSPTPSPNISKHLPPICCSQKWHRWITV